MWESIIDVVTKVNDFINGIVWGWPVIILILGTGILLTVRSKFIQLRKFGDSVSSTIVPAFKGIGKSDKKKTGSVSPFEAFATAISGTVGTGNIIGVTTA
ncbi:MAG: alanine:cation symporter family protein, partial [Clostridia bacterium]|nr:alanine:cation symporter family protein [Clostridia bacterium]